MNEQVPPRSMPWRRGWGLIVALPFVCCFIDRSWWLKAGYHLLTLFFVYFTVVFAYAALRPVG